MIQPTVLLAALDNGTHVQVGRVKPHAVAYAMFERLDSHQSGWWRDQSGALRSGDGHMHYIDGHAVRFYRLRQQGHEFGDVPSYPVRAIRFTNPKEVRPMKSTTKTPSGIKRPETGTYRSWSAARSKARDLNEAHGRGRRALKAQDGGYAVIFRPKVAANKQRRVRDLGAI